MKCTTASSGSSWNRSVDQVRKGTALTPGQLLQWIATRPAKKEVCIECGAGLGELAMFFRSHFERVTATDLAPPKQKSPYGVTVIKAAAEHLPETEGSVDLLISMQALHFFNIADHLSEARRVLRPGGVFAALCWGEIILPDTILGAYQPTFTSLAPHWEKARGWVLSGYSDLAFPGRHLTLPQARMTRPMSISGLDAEIARWSATRRAVAADAEIIDPNLSGLDRDAQFPVHWPILGQVFQV